MGEVLEQAIARNPFEIKHYLRYIDRCDSPLQTAHVYERGVRQLPRSFKLWKRYLILRTLHVSASKEEECEKVCACFERALVLLHTMPRIWLMYLDFMAKRSCVSRTRHIFDRALRSLPLSQHPRIWECYLPWARKIGGRTAYNVWKRYTAARQEYREDFIELLQEIGDYEHAAKEYVALLDLGGKSRHGKSSFELWMDFCDLLVARPNLGMDVDRILEAGMDRFPDQSGRLFVSLATYHISRREFERARDVFEKGITTVMTIRDFSQIFDAYAQFEESYVSALVEQDRTDVDLAILRFETLLNRRPFLVSDVILRQNSHHVAEWIHRVGLWGKNEKQVIETYTTAIHTISPQRAHGKLSSVYVSFARYLQSRGNTAGARRILIKATEAHYRTVEELAEVWIALAEFELEAERFDEALALLREAMQSSKKSPVDIKDDNLTPQARLHKSIKLWSFYLDLVESVSDLPTTREVYERLFDLRIATPQTVVNYAALLEEHNYFEDSYKIYERGIALFSFPTAFELWNLYLTKAAKGLSLERLRDLFEQALSTCPPTLSAPLWVMYADIESKRGLIRNAMRLYERAESSVDMSYRAQLFRLHALCVAENFGKPALRSVYEAAISHLPEVEACEFALAFTKLEVSLGEVDRARAVYVHASQFADPNTNAAYWTAWREFEIAYGNEDTFREMLRVKRSVEAARPTDAAYMARVAKNAPIGFIKGETQGNHIQSDDIENGMEREEDGGSAPEDGLRREDVNEEEIEVEVQDA